MPRVTCKSCKCFIADEDALIGECRLYPEVYQVQPGHWCGQYKRRPKVEKEEKDAEPAPEPKLVIQYFAGKFQEKYGVSYSPEWARDTTAAKKLVKEDGRDKTKEYINAFINDPPKWYKENNQINLYNIPKARNQIKLKAAKVSRPEHDVAISAQAEDYGSEANWPDYVDYKRKGGHKSYEEWRDR